MRFRGTNAPSNVGVLLISRRAVPSLPISATCTTMLSPGMLTVLSGFNIKNRNWTLPLFIPNLTSLIGLKVMAQAFLPSTSSPLGFELSNGLLMTLGK